jgi:Na+-transporting NADH:ubiquinone oxidoreductase subunit NqrA
MLRREIDVAGVIKLSRQRSELAQIDTHAVCAEHYSVIGVTKQQYYRGVAVVAVVAAVTVSLCTAELHDTVSDCLNTARSSMADMYSVRGTSSTHCLACTVLHFLAVSQSILDDVMQQLFCSM